MPDNSQKIRRAKQVQAPLSYASGAMGVAGLGALALRKKSPAANKVYAPLTTASVGVGSVGSFNFARLQGLESKHNPRKPRQNVYVVRNKKQIEEIKQGKRTVAKADRKKKRDYSGAAVGTGTVVGATGLVGGGVPGARPDSGRLAQARGGKHTKTELTRHIVSGTRGGIFGYREDAHRRFLNNQNERLKNWKPHNRGNAFERGRELGKTIPERTIIRHMKTGRTASNVALGGGAALVGGGLYMRKKNKQRVSKAKNDNYKFRSDAMIAGGATTAAGSAVGSAALDYQGKKWSKRSQTNVARAQKMVPKTGGYEVIETKRGGVRNIRRSRNRVPDVKPNRSTGDIIWNHKEALAGRSKKKAAKVGQLRGIATQDRYFASVYGNTARSVRRLGVGGGLAVAGAGLAHRKYELKPRKVSKALESGGTMDFGLSSVRQGEHIEVSKAKQKTVRQGNQEERQRIRNSAFLGAAGAPTAAYYGSHAAGGAKSGYQLGRFVGNNAAKSMASGGRAVPSALRGAGGAGKMLYAGMKHPFKAYGLMLGGGIVAGNAKLKQVNNERMKRGAPIIKAYNPEDRRYRRSEKVIGAQPYVTGAAAAGAGYYGTKSYKAGRSAVGDFRSGLANEATRSRLVGQAKTKTKTNPDKIGAWKKAARHPGGSVKIASGLDSAKLAGKHAGAAAGLGAVAIGAKLGSDRIKSYYEKKGRTYRPLHRNVH